MVGRNEQCPCGSGLKFKKCHGNEARDQAMKRAVQKAQFDALLHNLKEKKRKTTYGQIRPIIHTNSAGKKVVAVGRHLYFSEKWKTFPDFLSDYLKTTIGTEWSKKEFKKPLHERHQILKIYNEVCKAMKRGNEGASEAEIFQIAPCGAVNYWFRLGYDLYALSHHSALQEKILERLRIPQQFQGARYELFVTAAFLRAGFEIEFEDEGDSTSTHPEFTATHRKSGVRLSVEAKSRHREGILDFKPSVESSKKDGNANIRPILMKALRKSAKHPYFIFIDVNLPKTGQQIQFTPWFKEICEEEDKIKAEVWKGPFPASAIIYTNDPSQHDFEVEGGSIWAFGKDYTESQNPPYPKEIFSQVIESLTQAGNIPQDFPE